MIKPLDSNPGDDSRETAESLERTANELIVAVNDLTKRTTTTDRTARRVRILSILVLLFGAFGFWTTYRYNQTEEDKEHAAAVASCESANATRAIIRQMVRDGGIESGVLGGEALLHVVGQTRGEVDPAVAELYRQVLTERLGVGLAEIVNKLPDREWIDGECVDVPVSQTE